jgi:DNA polymerase-4
LFTQENVQRRQINSMVDNVNQKYGELTLMPARLVERSSMPNVIAPAWKPSGLRKTI